MLKGIFTLVAETMKRTQVTVEGSRFLKLRSVQEGATSATQPITYHSALAASNTTCE